jgi:cell fate regulator YaaT (PSP1 superfamily)
MMKIAGIRFRDNWKVYDFDSSDVDVAVGDAVIVESDRGLGFARVVRVREAEELPPLAFPPKQERETQRARREQEGKNGGPKEEEVEIDIETAAPAEKEKAPVPKGHRKVLRKATEDDVRKADKNRVREAEAFRVCQEMISEREMPMKLIRVEYAFDASRATFYFFSENRVDFRELVKDLAHKLRSRIEMRQVGVRDVARMIGGFGPCGRELCCTSFLRGFEPVSIRMAKKQEMVLNPAKISGVCGRLLCCLSYEFSVYDEIKKDIAEMKDAAAREKKEEAERRQEAERQEAEERRLDEEKRRLEEERRKQEQKQRDRQRQQEQKEARRPEKKREPQQEQKGRPPQEQRERQQPQQKAPEQQKAAEGQPQAEKQGKRKRRFWRKKKKKDGGEGKPAGPEGREP